MIVHGGLSRRFGRERGANLDVYLRSPSLTLASEEHTLPGGMNTDLDAVSSLPNDSTHPRSDKLRARAWFTLAFAIYLSDALLVIVASVRFATLDPLRLLFGNILIVVAGTALARLGSRCFIRARRLGAANASDLLARDPRSPVIYLRPFFADDVASKSVGYTSWKTDEEQLELAMKEIGPFVTIGRPTELTPHVGAARVYLEEDQWQQHARMWIASAQLLVLRVGESEALWWELQTALASRPLQRLLLLVPSDQQAYEVFRRRAHALIPELPPLSGWERKRWFRAGLHAIISFDSQGGARVLDLSSFQIPFLQRNPAFPLVPLLRAGLAPLYSELELPWSPPPVSKRTLILLGCAVVTVVAIAVAVLDQCGAFGHLGGRHEETEGGRLQRLIAPVNVDPRLTDETRCCRRVVGLVMRA